MDASPAALRGSSACSRPSLINIVDRQSNGRPYIYSES